MKKQREDERENEERCKEMKENLFFKKMFEDPETHRMSWPKMFRKKSLSDKLFLQFSSKVQNLTVFSIIHMIRIRFFRPGELIQNGFRAARYRSEVAVVVDEGARRFGLGRAWN